MYRPYMGVFFVTKELWHGIAELSTELFKRVYNRIIKFINFYTKMLICVKLLYIITLKDFDKN